MTPFRDPRRRGRRARRWAAAAALALLALAAAQPARADPSDPAPEHDGYLLRLGEHFYGTGQYYRAIGTFEELRFVTGDDALIRHADLRIAMSYHHGLQVRAAAAAYDHLLASRRLGGAAAGYVRLLRSLIRVEGTWRAAEIVPLPDLAAELAPLEGHDGAPYQILATYHLARLRLAGGDRAEARAAYERGLARCKARPVDDCAALARIGSALSSPGPRRRSPYVGLALSTVVPGLGSLYSGHSFDAVYYFGLTVGAGLMAWDIHEPQRGFGDQRISFYVLSSLAATFYISSVAQGWFGALRFNEAEAFEHRRGVLRTTELPLPLEDGALDKLDPPGEQ